MPRIASHAGQARADARRRIGERSHHAVAVHPVFAVCCHGPATTEWTASSPRSEEHTSELQSLMRISYAVFCLKKKKKTNIQTKTNDCTNNEKRDSDHTTRSTKIR